MRMLSWVVVFVIGCASTSAPAPRNGATRPASNDAGFEVWQATKERWIDPDTFLADDKASRPPNKWPDADVFPAFAQTKEHDDLLLMTPDGPCEMYFFHTRWRRRADVKNWGQELRRYQACGKVFSRDVGFAQ